MGTDTSIGRNFSIEVISSFVRRFSVAAMLAVAIPSPAASASGGSHRTFARDGKVLVSVGEGGSYARATTIQPDGNILLAGQALLGGRGVMAIVRMSSNGSVDPHFGVHGRALVPVSSISTEAMAIATQPDGTILLAGRPTGTSLSQGFILAKLLSDGSLDRSFGVDGVATASPGNGASFATCMAVLEDGSAVLAGAADIGGHWSFGLIRFTHSGNVDDTFGILGNVTTDLGGDAIPYGLVIQQDGKILLAGGALNSTYSDFAAVRFYPNGALDQDFGVGGSVTSVIGPATSVSGSPNDAAALSVAIDALGRIVLVGFTTPNPTGENPQDFAMARLTSRGALDLNFGTGGVLLADFGLEQEAGMGVVFQADGRILVTSGAAGDFSLVRLSEDGLLDAAFGQGGLLQVDFDGDFDAPLSLTLNSGGDAILGGYANWNSVPHFAAVQIRFGWGFAKWLSK